jgi:hypothetical protein
MRRITVQIKVHVCRSTADRTTSHIPVFVCSQLDKIMARKTDSKHHNISGRGLLG